jgi:nitrite reductase/ring-hydroxylating ferredoxin subunit
VRYELFAAAELAPGTMRAATAGSISVVVIRTPDGQLHALRNVCSHMGAKLSDGLVHQASEADPAGGYCLSDEFVISCPWHGFEFSVDTGRCLADARHRARTYAVTQEGDMIVLER